MEGVMLVEMSSGALHYTKSFTDRFDAHHPKSERLNFGALIFALHNFAGSSIRGKYHNDGSGAETETNRPAAIAMYSTPLEKMVLTATPSNKLLVVLFTTPELDTEVAKLIVRHLADKYESCNSTCTEELTTALNQVPRRFRLAFSQSVDDAVETELIHFGETILIPLVEEFGSTLDGEEFFLFFYFSSCLDDSSPEGSNGLTTGRTGGSAAHPEEKCGYAVRAANPTVSDILRHNAKTFSIRNIVTSTRAMITSHASTKKKPFRWRSRNAVMNHSEPHEFRRVVEVRTHERKVALIEPHRAGSAYGIADVLSPFVKLSSSWTTSPNNTVDKLTSQKLNQIIWKNIPGSSLVKEKRHGANIIAWRSGPCCIFYPITARCTDPESKARERHAVSALFSVLDPLLNAKLSSSLEIRSRLLAHGCSFANDLPSVENNANLHSSTIFSYRLLETATTETKTPHQLRGQASLTLGCSDTSFYWYWTSGALKTRTSCAATLIPKASSSRPHTSVAP